MAAFMRCSEHGAGRSMDGLDQDDPATVKSRRCGAAAPYRKLKTREGRPCPSFEEAASSICDPRSPIPPHSGLRQPARGGLG
jgi:hypothetical protein